MGVSAAAGIRTRPPRWVRVALDLGLFLFFVPWFSVQVLPASWFFIFGTWAVLMFGRAFGGAGRKRRALWFNIGVAFLTLAGAELYLELRQPNMAGPLPGAQDGYVQADADLGYAPVPGEKSTIAYWYGDEKIHETTYTIDEKGCRVAHPAPSPPAALVAFFGGSYVYGHALADHETLPNRVAELSGGRFTAANLAFFGYGPHQMLAMLQSGRAEAAVPKAPSHAFYLAIPHHALRVAGRAGWDDEGPWYRLLPDGTVRREGQFTDRLSAPARRLRKWLRASNLYDLLHSGQITQEHLDLMATVVAASRDRVAEIWPGCRFHVLLWDAPRSSGDRTASALRARGLEVHRLSEALPAFHEIPGPYALHAHDGHPNGHAASSIAAWVVREFLGAP